jgi:hypothetical protein
MKKKILERGIEAYDKKNLEIQEKIISRELDLESKKILIVI